MTPAKPIQTPTPRPTSSSIARGLDFAPLALVVLLTGVALALLALGVTPRYVRPDEFGFLFEIVAGLGYSAVGTLILRHRPGHRIGRAMIVSGLMTGGGAGASVIVGTVDALAVDLGPIAALFAAAEGLFGIGILIASPLILVWFPGGRRTSRLGGVVEALVLTAALKLGIGLVPTLALPAELDELPFFLLLGAYAAAVADLTVRYRTASGLDRAQIRWVLACGAVTVGLGIAVAAVGEQVGELFILWLSSFILPIVGIGIAITRYRLYDIDRIISRTIGYGIVTAILLGVFAGLILLVPNLIGSAASGDGSELPPLLVAASTLVTAILFSPVRSRVQALVDRRFNRARHDAERTVARLAGSLRDELDLEAIAATLHDTAADAVEPSATSVWLRDRPEGAVVR